ncbi:MAG: hypothetical protein HYT99_01385 [Candidatus Tectomicrobia bacterium]|nr:hypothetical protein [Candidatus Tectomicrobia bacterium]MBI2131467.1 hypothetical protein [Candidatus Tectomicrobia bacterium]MBI2177989.1 hypothetical protein [Candidatus Tectomicrobia bacterium]
MKKNIWVTYKDHRYQLTAAEGEGGDFTCSSRVLCPDGSRREVRCPEKFATLRKAQAAGRKLAKEWIDARSKG